MNKETERKLDEDNKIEKETEPKKINVDNLSPRQIMELDACTRCGECLQWCPVYNQDEREGVTPRSKATRFRKILSSQHGLFRTDSLLGKLFRRKKTSSEELNQFAIDLYECSTCRQCHFVCPSQIDTVELWEGIRKSFADAGYGPLEPQKNLIQSVQSYDNPWGQPRSSRSRWAKIAKKKKRIEDMPKDLNKEKADILYFVGCTASYDNNIEEVGINTIKILQHAGVDFGILGAKEKCCGSVLLRMGDYATFHRLAIENIEQINALGVKTLITSCAGCFKTIKNDYIKEGKANFRTLHTLEFILELIKEGKLKLEKKVPLKVTYHDPCHLGRHSSVYDAPRKLLKLIDGIELIEMERKKENSRCCGAGGGLKSGFPDIQNKISQTRINEAVATGATELVSACPFCYQGLQVGIQALNAPIKMRDITELVCMAIGVEPVAMPYDNSKKQATA